MSSDGEKGGYRGLDPLPGPWALPRVTGGRAGCKEVRKSSKRWQHPELPPAPSTGPFAPWVGGSFSQSRLCISHILLLQPLVPCNAFASQKGSVEGWHLLPIHPLQVAYAPKKTLKP